MVTAKVLPGPCRFKAVVEASRVNDHAVHIKIKSSCRHVRLLGDLLGEVDINECIKSFNDNPVLNLSKNVIPHPSCIIPAAVLKCVEVESGLALKENMAIVFK